jgi:oligopeptide transport system substrate-binding protein
MVSTANWFGDYGDPTTFLDINRAGDGNNDRAFADPRYDALLDRAMTETEPAGRLRLLEQAERLLIEEDAPLIPLVHEGTLAIFDPHVITGISAHPRQKQLMGMLRRLDRAN